MRRNALPFFWVVLAALLAGCTMPPQWEVLPETSAVASCPVTEPNGETPPGELPADVHHGNGKLWTALWPHGTVLIPQENVQPDGKLAMKWPWWRAVQGALTLRGHRLDGATSPLEAKIPKGYGDSGFQATGLIFPNEGCWEITAEAGGSALTIITQVVRERSEG